MNGITVCTVEPTPDLCNRYIAFAQDDTITMSSYDSDTLFAYIDDDMRQGYIESLITYRGMLLVHADDIFSLNLYQLLGNTETVYTYNVINNAPEPTTTVHVYRGIERITVPVETRCTIIRSMTAATHYTFSAFNEHNYTIIEA